MIHAWWYDTTIIFALTFFLISVYLSTRKRNTTTIALKYCWIFSLCSSFFTFSYNLSESCYICWCCSCYFWTHMFICLVYMVWSSTFFIQTKFIHIFIRIIVGFCVFACANDTYVQRYEQITVNLHCFSKNIHRILELSIYSILY